MEVRHQSVVLLSGGLDSAINLAFCHHRDSPVLAVTVDYGQMAARQEIRAARALSLFFSVPHQVLHMPWLGDLGGSALTSHQALPEPDFQELDHFSAAQKTAQAVWVPNRNGVLVNGAAAFAESLGATHVVVGFNREEAATFPDNSPEFMEALESTFAYSTSNGVKLKCYTSWMDKREMVESVRLLEPAFPFQDVWSCYRGGPSQVEPCGRCESCGRFKRALGSFMEGSPANRRKIIEDEFRADSSPV